MAFEKAKDTFVQTLRRTDAMHSALSLLHWDMKTIMPKKGAEARAQVLGAIDTEAYRLMTGEAFGEAMEMLSQNADRLSRREKRMLTLAKRDFDRNKKIPMDEYEAFSVATAQANCLWVQAKETNDYAAFAPHLQKIIDLSRRFVNYWGYADKPYDAMLENYDPALLSAQIDPIFARLLQGTRALLARAGKNTVLPDASVSAERQAAIGAYLLGVIGYDQDAGNLYTTEHPFTSRIHAGDTRVTTKYHAGAPLSSIFSVLHEGGHGLYEQNISPALDGTNLGTGASMSIHESQSRFWENTVGRSMAFWQTHLEKVGHLAGVPLAENAETFFRAINAVEPSLIRIEADELTYNLHIIIRYELEKAIFNDGANSDALPGLWADKYEEYLGVRPKTDAEGLLQDSHWAGGSFGYFPSYALGNLCAAQFAHVFEQAHGPLADSVGSPEGIRALLDWQKENIHRHGREETPREIMLRVCNEDINPDFFLHYMEQKLQAVYPGF